LKRFTKVFQIEEDVESHLLPAASTPPLIP